MSEVARLRKKLKTGKAPYQNIPAVKPTYDVPKWAGKPPPGMHLDVSKEGKLIEKFIVDGSTHFFFGRQKEYIDFTIDHTSCSRVHAVIVFHKPLNRMFLIDLGSTHGTFMGSIRLDSNRPMQLPIDETFHFGASTRTWTLREKPNIPSSVMDTSLNSSLNASEQDSSNLSLLGLPEAENELNDLTEYNTAHNRRSTNLPVDETTIVNPRKRRRSSLHSVTFTGDDEVINPEDVDPTVGRFRNLVSTEIITPNKASSERRHSYEVATDSHLFKPPQDFQSNNLYNDGSVFELTSPISITPKITSAPEVESPDLARDKIVFPIQKPLDTFDHAHHDPVRKKYIKEAWPGRKPKGQNLLSV